MARKSNGGGARGRKPRRTGSRTAKGAKGRKKAARASERRTTRRPAADPDARPNRTDPAYEDPDEDAARVYVELQLQRHESAARHRLALAELPEGWQDEADPLGRHRESSGLASSYARKVLEAAVRCREAVRAGEAALAARAMADVVTAERLMVGLQWAPALRHGAKSLRGRPIVLHSLGGRKRAAALAEHDPAIRDLADRLRADEPGLRTWELAERVKAEPSIHTKRSVRGIYRNVLLPHFRAKRR